VSTRGWMGLLVSQNFNRVANFRLPHLWWANKSYLCWLFTIIMHACIYVCYMHMIPSFRNKWHFQNFKLVFESQALVSGKKNIPRHRFFYQKQVPVIWVSPIRQHLLCWQKILKYYGDSSLYMSALHPYHPKTWKIEILKVVHVSCCFHKLVWIGTRILSIKENETK
jgi:hypothetical protein